MFPFDSTAVLCHVYAVAVVESLEWPLGVEWFLCFTFSVVKLKIVRWFCSPSADGPTSAPHGWYSEGLPQGCVEVAYCASGNRNKVNVSFRLIVQSLPFHRGSGMCVVFASARMGCVLRLMLCKSQ